MPESTRVQYARVSGFSHSIQNMCVPCSTAWLRGGLCRPLQNTGSLCRPARVHCDRGRLLLLLRPHRRPDGDGRGGLLCGHAHLSQGELRVRLAPRARALLFSDPRRARDGQGQDLAAGLGAAADDHCAVDPAGLRAVALPDHPQPDGRLALHRVPLRGPPRQLVARCEDASDTLPTPLSLSPHTD